MLHLLDFLPLIVVIFMKKVGKHSCAQLNCLDTCTSVDFEIQDNTVCELKTETERT